MDGAVVVCVSAGWLNYSCHCLESSGVAFAVVAGAGAGDLVMRSDMRVGLDASVDCRCTYLRNLIGLFLQNIKIVRLELCSYRSISKRKFVKCLIYQK